MPTEPHDMESLILDKKQLIQKVNRMAIEIYEQNFQESEIVVAGIAPNGYNLATLLVEELKRIATGINVLLVKITLEKTAPHLSPIHTDIPLQDLSHKVIVLTDDVMNTGRVLAYALQTLLTIPSKKIQTAVMVDRSHQHYPIVANFVGYSLATTFKEHVEVSFEESRFGAYLH